MKKRIIISSLITVLFALIIVTGAFIAIINLREIDQTQEILSIYNDLVANEKDYNIESLKKYKIEGNSVRFTFIKKDGKVIFDTFGDIAENHNDREEIKNAFEKEYGHSVRYSSTKGMNMVYYATKLDDDTVLRSSVPISAINIFTKDVLKYYIFVLIIVLLLSLGLSIKLVKIIVHPVKELERVTTKIASGELNKRAMIYNYDEIGSLAQTFNEMADQLQVKINDVIDKQNKLEAILESMDSGVIAVDSEGKIMLINPYVKKLFGLRGDMIGELVSEHIIDYDLMRFIKDIPDIDSKEIKLFHPVEREIRVKKAPIISSSRYPIGVVVTLSDITDIKRLENMRSQFVANVSHELKTPLTSIKGFSETLRYVNDEDTRNKFLDIIDKEAERLTRLINDILVLSNLENLHNMKSENFKPLEVVSDVIDMVNTQLESKKIQMKLNNQYNGQLIGDRDKFYQLVLNLVENSVKYSEEEDKIFIDITSKDNKFIFEIRDTGIGIPEEDLPRIFERFYRVDKSRTTKGTGLGLAIVKHIVKLFNGEIYVDSTFGEGSKFTVKLNI